MTSNLFEVVPTIAKSSSTKFHNWFHQIPTPDLLTNMFYQIRPPASCLPRQHWSVPASMTFQLVPQLIQPCSTPSSTIGSTQCSTSSTQTCPRESQIINFFLFAHGVPPELFYGLCSSLALYSEVQLRQHEITSSVLSFLLRLFYIVLCFFRVFS